MRNMKHKLIDDYAQHEITALSIIRKATDKELVALLARAKREPGEAASVIADAIRSEMGMRAAKTYTKRHYN